MWLPACPTGRTSYISGGATTPGGGNTNALYRYNPAAHTVQNLGNFTLHPAGFDFHSSWYIPPGVLPGLPNGGVCVGGGVDSSSVVFADTQCYNFATNSFNTPNADLGQLPVAHWGGADFVLDPPGPDFQLWIVNGVDSAFALWPYSMYYSALDDAWHYGPDPAAAVYRVEGRGGSRLPAGHPLGLGKPHHRHHPARRIQPGGCDLPLPGERRRGPDRHAAHPEQRSLQQPAGYPLDVALPRSV